MFVNFAGMCKRVPFFISAKKWGANRNKPFFWESKIGHKTEQILVQRERLWIRKPQPLWEPRNEGILACAVFSNQEVTSALTHSAESWPFSDSVDIYLYVRLHWTLFGSLTQEKRYKISGLKATLRIQHCIYILQWEHGGTVQSEEAGSLHLGPETWSCFPTIEDYYSVLGCSDLCLLKRWSNATWLVLLRWC